MAHAQMPDTFFELAVHHLPPEQPVGPKGGRPSIDHRVVLNMLWFVLVTGCRWEDVPPQLGCTGRTAHHNLRLWEEIGVWDRLHVDLLRLLRQANKLDPDLVIVDAVLVRAFGGGEQTGPSPVDRRKKGSKHPLLVDRYGVPLAIRTAPANESDVLGCNHGRAALAVDAVGFSKGRSWADLCKTARSLPTVPTYRSGARRLSDG
jgi:transposase